MFSLFTMLILTVQGFSQNLAVLSRTDNELTIINLVNEQVIKNFKTGKSPHELVYDSVSNSIYIPSYGSNSLTKIDLKTKQSVGNFRIPNHSNLHDAIMLNNTLWLTSENKNAVINIHQSTGEFIQSYNTGGFRSHMITGIDALNKLFVANIDSGTVSIIDLNQDKIEVIKTGEGAEGIDRVLKKNEIWVSNRSDNTITIIDAVSNTVIKSFSSHGEFPVKLRVSPDEEEAWVSNNADGTIAVFDIDSYQLKKLINVGNRPLGITFSMDSNYAYVSKPGSNEILEIDIRNSYTIKRNIKGPKSPDGMVWLKNY